MKNLLAAFLILLTLTGQILAQRYHSPEEIFQRIDTSAMNYRIRLLAEGDTLVPEQHAVLEHGLLLWQERSGQPFLTTYHDQLQKNRYLADYLRLAEQALAYGNPVAARRAYMVVLAAAPQDAQEMTLIGQTYAMTGDTLKAVSLYRQAIANNYHDFLAHHLLADWHRRHHRADSALTEMAIAHVLNRNHALVLQDLRSLLQQQGRSYGWWAFRPLYLFEEQPDAKVIKYDLAAAEWLNYALCKALWRFEPGYADTVMQGVKAPASYIEEIEAVQIMLASRKSRTEIGPDPALQTLLQAAEDDRVLEYILYEILLPRDPGFVFHMPEAQIADLVNYIFRYRVRLD